jgi:hypothetical protein
MQNLEPCTAATMSRCAASLFSRTLGVCRSTALACAVLVVTSAHPARAGTNLWTSHGPDGGPVLALAIDPRTPSTLDAGTQGAGVFKSTDGGVTWSAANSGLPANAIVQALAIDPSTPTTLYAGTGWNDVGGVFKSTDGGGTWSAADTGPSAAVYSLAIDPSTPRTLYAGTFGGGVFKSTDSGITWSAANTGLIAASVLVLAIDPGSSSTLYAGTDGDGVFKSTNSGGTWSAANTGLTVPVITSLAIDPSTPSTLYAGTGKDDAGGGHPAYPRHLIRPARRAVLRRAVAARRLCTIGRLARSVGRNQGVVANGGRGWVTCPDRPAAPRRP